MIHDSPRGGRTLGFTEPAHLPGVVAQQTGGAQEKRRLPRSTRADEREGFSRRDREADSAQNVDRCEASARTGGKSFGESAELEGDNHGDRYTIALDAAASRRHAHHRKIATALAPGRQLLPPTALRSGGVKLDSSNFQPVQADGNAGLGNRLPPHALLLRPSCSA